ncbi:5-oxoprolinase [Fusarium agapanthi]|uniref:5-oxoprolinase n=1 Tax=Fusarium agapanthi TaxID=1803897 RepID=A0A9P5BHK3_9HYPO|nr:5-oxoprolinase [Fusarium agapanthi]
MHAITDNAEACVRDFLLRTYKETGGKPLFALDHIDVGTPIQLTITIDPDTASAHLDWTGTGEQGYHSFNAPQAITRSATLYVMRCLINQGIPLNEGCLRPLTSTIPEGSILNPSPEAAVCAGNPITSQRVTDVLIKAFAASAASQGDCNVVSFGTDGNIDVTTVERRNGIRRVYEFGLDMGCSVVSERRGTRPYGMNGGEDGTSGVNVNYIVKGGESGRWYRVGGRKDFKVEKGDWFVIDTPGGRTWGDIQLAKTGHQERNASERRFVSQFQLAQETSN